MWNKYILSSLVCMSITLVCALPDALARKLILENKSNKTVQAAVYYQDYSNPWVSKGWITVASRAKVTIDLPTGRDDVYVFGQANGGGTKWSGTHWHYVNPNGNFLFKNDKTEGKPARKEGFTKVTAKSYGDNIFIFKQK